MTRWVVSVEGLTVPCRAAILKSLQSDTGLRLLDGEPPHAAAHPLRHLLDRLSALAAVPEGADALWSGSWLLDVPADAAWEALHAELGQELAHTLLPRHGQGTKHLMILLNVDPDEAFEFLLSAEASACQTSRELSLQQVRDTGAKLADVARSAAASPFETRIAFITCPPYAADNPATLARVCDLACAQYREALKETGR